MAEASSTTTSQRPSSAMKPPCVTCSKPIGILRCEGCQKLFCRKDLNEHRNGLTQQLDVLTTEHDAFQQVLNQTKADPSSHALIRRIDAWEKESITKIRQAADEARRQIETFVDTNAQEISTRFREMADRLKQERKEDTFDERDLKRWMEQLAQLEQNFTSPSSVEVGEDPGVFIAKIQVKDVETLGKIFQQVSGSTQLADGGLAVVCVSKSPNQAAEVRSKGEYSRGIHTIQLKIENYSNGALFFGVVSKSTPMQNYSYNTAPSCGWLAGVNNTVYIHGQASNNYNGYVSDFKVNDIVELEIDCYRRCIKMKNNRTNKQYELPIDLAKCPFPWLFDVNFSTYGDRIRIVP